MRTPRAWAQREGGWNGGWTVDTGRLDDRHASILYPGWLSKGERRNAKTLLSD